MALSGWVLAAALPALAAEPPRIFSPEQVRYLYDGADSADACASQAYHALRKDPEEAAVRPDWVLPRLAELWKKTAYTDAEEGARSYAAAWQQPSVSLYEFFGITRGLLPAGCAHAAPCSCRAFSGPAEALQVYRERRAILERDLRRLGRSPARKALGARGERLMSAYYRVLEGFRAVERAIEASDAPAFAAAVMEVGRLSRQAKETLMGPEAPRSVPDPPRADTPRLKFAPAMLEPGKPGC